MIRLPNLNLVVLCGRLTADPILEYVNQKTPFAKFTIAVNESYKDKTGEWTNKVNFIGINVWGKLAKFSAENLHKGSPVMIQGSIQVQTWKDEESNNRTVYKINAQQIQSLEKEKDDPLSREKQETTDEEESENDDNLPF